MKAAGTAYHTVAGGFASCGHSALPISNAFLAGIAAS